MKEHLNDYEKRIWEGIDKDAEEIIKMVEADPEAMSVEPSEEMDRKIYAMIPGHKDADSEDSALEGLSEEDQEALRLGRELQKRRKEKEEEKIQSKKTTSPEAGHSCGSSIGACDRNRNNRSGWTEENRGDGGRNIWRKRCLTSECIERRN